MSGGETKKREIERRLLLARFPRANGASDVPLVFSDDDDHDPLVLEDCPACRGRGTRCDESDGMARLDTCDACDGAGTTFALVRHFANDAAPVEVTVDASGWVTCPGCHRRFSTRASSAWTGRRHMRCGQRITLALGPRSK